MNYQPALPGDHHSFTHKMIGRFIDIRPQEMKALGWSWLYIFPLFLACYVLRPIRDELGVADGVGNLPWLFTGTLAAMLVLNPLYSYIVRSWARERFIAIAYRFFVLNLAGFALLLGRRHRNRTSGLAGIFHRASVFNLLVVSVSWSLVVAEFGHSCWPLSHFWPVQTHPAALPAHPRHSMRGLLHFAGLSARYGHCGQPRGLRSAIVFLLG